MEGIRAHAVLEVLVVEAKGVLYQALIELKRPDQDQYRWRLKEYWIRLLGKQYDPTKTTIGGILRSTVSGS
jgi:hypothetical protein